MDIFSKIRRGFLSIFAPSDPLTEEIEMMAPAQFLAKAERLKIGREMPKSVVLFEYSSPLVRKGVWEIKFRGNKRIARLIASLLYDELVERLAEEKMFGGENRASLPLLLPIPISSARRRERGWNQCDIIAGELARLDGGKNFLLRKDILTKTKSTQDQVGKGRAERLNNLEGSFTVKDGSSIADRFVIVLDDVITTGATIEEAGRAVKQSGAKKILFLAIAH